ncbi:TPA: lipid IV(A) 4-amino-4-deoxy-L-arabinosyltransferase [Providencia alcalifaciens]
MMMANNKKAYLKWCLLFGFVLITYFLPLNGRMLWQPDELRYAEISRELILSSHWSVPELLGIRYFEKPIFGYWVGSFFQMLFGENNVSVRLGVVFSTLISGLFVYLSAKMAWKNKDLAFNAVLIYLSMFMILTIGTYNILDPIVTAFITMIIFFFQWGITTTQRTHKLYAYILIGVACGLGVMTKGFLVLVLPVLVCSVSAIYFKKLKEICLYALVSIFVATLVCLPWALTIASLEPDFWSYFFWVEHIQRFMADNAQNKSPFWFYVPILVAAVLPWLGYLVSSIAYAIRAKGINLYFLLWAVLPFLFFSITKGKLLTYILPCIAPIAILMASYLQQVLTQNKVATIRLNALINITLGVVAAGTFIASPYFPKMNLYQGDESYKMWIAAGAFLFWAAMGIVSFNRKYWSWAAACTLALSLSIGHVIPKYIESNNTPQGVLAKYQDQLQNRAVLLTNNVGLGTALAWGLKRDDITMLYQTGELGYGLNYPDAENRFYRLEQLPSLLASQNNRNVAVVVDASQNEVIDALPGTPIIIKEGKLVMAFYEGQ